MRKASVGADPRGASIGLPSGSCLNVHVHTPPGSSTNSVSGLCSCFTRRFRSRASRMKPTTAPAFMTPNSATTTMKRNFSLVTMSAGFRLSRSLRLHVVSLGVRAAAKSVKWRHMHRVTLLVATQPVPLNACSVLFQLQEYVLLGCHSAQWVP